MFANILPILYQANIVWQKVIILRTCYYHQVLCQQVRSGLMPSTFNNLLCDPSPECIRLQWSLGMCLKLDCDIFSGLVVLVAELLYSPWKIPALMTIFLLSGSTNTFHGIFPFLYHHIPEFCSYNSESSAYQMWATGNSHLEISCFGSCKDFLPI